VAENSWCRVGRQSGVTSAMDGESHLARGRRGSRPLRASQSPPRRVVNFVIFSSPNLHQPHLRRLAGHPRQGSVTDAARFFFPSNANEERMQPRCLGRVKHSHGTGARRDHSSFGKADPLASVLIEELVADGPVVRLVFAPVGAEVAARFQEAVGRQCSSSITSGIAGAVVTLRRCAAPVERRGQFK
jgi:hypothetical protein